MKTYFQLSIRMANIEIKILLLLKKGNPKPKAQKESSPKCEENFAKDQFFSQLPLRINIACVIYYYIPGVYIANVLLS